MRLFAVGKAGSMQVLAVGFSTHQFLAFSRYSCAWELTEGRQVDVSVSRSCRDA